MPAILAVLLVAALCPVVVAGPASASGSSVEVPPQFRPMVINNDGVVAGIDFGSLGLGQVPAALVDGELRALSSGLAVDVFDISDGGDVLFRGTNLEVRNISGGGTVFPKPVIDGRERNIFRGYGPDANGRVIGVFGFDFDPQSSSVEYIGASPPRVITALATVFAMNHSGQVLGQLPGNEFVPAILENGTVRTLGGFTGRFAPGAFGDGGHFLYRSTAGSYLWYDGTSTFLGNVNARAVNSRGVVAMTTFGSTPTPQLRLPTGETVDLDAFAPLPAGWSRFTDILDINDDCTVIARGLNAQNQTRHAVVEIPDCAPVDFGGEFFRVDGGARYVKEGDPAEVRLRVENSSGRDMTGVRVTSIEVEEDDSGGVATVKGGVGPIGDLAGTGPASVGFADLELTGVTQGTVTLRAGVSGTRDGDVVTGTIESEFEVRDAPLRVEVIPPEEPVRLEVRTEGDRDETGQLVEGTYVAQEVPMTVRLTAAEDADDLVEIKPFETIEGDGGIDIDLIRKQGEGFVDVVPQPVPFPASWAGPFAPPPGEGEDPLPPGAEPSFPIERLEPGESVDLQLTVTVESPGTFEVESFFEALTDPDEGPQVVVRSIGSGVLRVAGDAILAVEIHADRNQGAPPRIDEGGRAQFTGTVKNLSLTDTIDLSPIRGVSLGQGQVLGPVELTEPFPADGGIGFFDPLLAPGPGPESEATFKIAVDTTSLPGVGWELLSGRESVILDLAIKGVVIDPEGVERDLDPTVDVTLDVGNGRWINGVRVEVDPKLNPQPLIEVDQIAWALFGEVAESVGQAGYTFFANIPGMLKSMPTVLAALGSGAVNLASTTGEADLLAIQYAWTWAEYQFQVLLAMDPSERQAEMDAIAADLARLYDEDIAPVAAAVNQGIEGFFANVLEYKAAADAAGDRGDVRALIEQTGDAVEVVSQVVIEEITGQAVLNWIAKGARSERATRALARARERLNVEEVRKLEGATDEMRAAQVNPKVQQASPALKGVSPGTPVSAVQAIRGWAIDRVSDANLRRITGPGGRPIMVAIRSRADETLEWLETTLGMTPKPVTVKPKNVNLDDCNFLGYRCGEIGYEVDGSRSLGDRGSVAMREPITRPELIRRLDSAGVDDFTRTRVLKRHDKRWKEWYGEACPHTRVACAAPNPPLPSKWTELLDATPVIDIGADGLRVRRGELEVPTRNHPPEMADNFDTAGKGDIYDKRALELREVRLEDGTSSWEMWLEDFDGNLKRVSGDIDTVSVTYTDGRSFDPDSDYARDVLLELQEGIDAQHPWSSSLTSPELRREFLEDHLWDPDPLKRGEPLLIYVGGEARVGYFDPAKVADMVDSTSTNPLSDLIWLEGGPNNIDAAVKRQIDLRQQIVDPLSQPTPQGHVRAETEVRSALLRANQEARVTRNAAEIQRTADRYATCAITTSRAVRTPAAVWRMSDRLQQRTADGTFEDADPGADCDDGELVILPETAITESIKAGATVLPIIEELLGFDWLDMFRIGDCITIDAGMPNEESACIVDHGSLVLDRPLQFDHDRYARVVMDTPGDDPAPDPDPEPDPGPGTDPGGDGGSGGPTPDPTGDPTVVGGPGGDPATAVPPGASPVAFTADPPPPASVAGETQGSGGGALAFTGTGTYRIVYLGTLLALIGLAILAATRRRDDPTARVLARR